MEIINYEPMSDWPVYRLTLGEILEELGATWENGVFGFKEDSTLLNRYVRTLVDDGMGYGIKEMWITEVDPVNIDENKKPIITLWRENKLTQEELDKRALNK